MSTEFWTCLHVPWTPSPYSRSRSSTPFIAFCLDELSNVTEGASVVSVSDSYLLTIRKVLRSKDLTRLSSELLSGMVFTALRESHEKAVCLSVRPSVRPSVCLPNAWFVTKRKKVVPLPTFLYHMKDHLPSFCDKKNGWWRLPILPEILGQVDPVEAKSPIFSRYSLVAPQR